MNIGFGRVLIADDLPHCRKWFAAAVQRCFPEAEIVLTENLAHSLVCVDQHARDERFFQLALVDLDLGDGSGMDLLKMLQRRMHNCFAVVATLFDDDAHVFPALSAGAHGYILKDEPLDSLAHMLSLIVAGQPPLSASIARRLLRHFAAPPRAATSNAVSDIDGRLTERENSVLTLTAKGYTVPQTAELLSLSKHTVAGYVKEIYRKLGISSRAEAALEANRLGLTS